MDLRAFLTTYRCTVIERLQIIHDNRERKMHRFLILALRFRPQNYVQCLFLDGDTRMLCEASSGFYATLPVENRRYCEGRSVWRRLPGSVSPPTTPKAISRN